MKGNEDTSMSEEKISGSGESKPSGRMILFWVSLLSLFIEILMIRHLASEIRIFAYFKNLALIGAFLGLGFGYLYKPKIPIWVTAVCMAMIALATHPYSGFASISEFLSFKDMNTWSSSEVEIHIALFGLLMLAIVFFLVILAMAPMGQVLAEIFDKSQNRILDYSINIIGALAGIWLFSLMSFMMLDPVYWYLFGAIGLMVLILKDYRQMAIIGALTLVMALTLSMQGSPRVTTKWSPYQKIDVSEKKLVYIVDGERNEIDYHYLSVNSTLYMFLLDLSDNLRAKHPKLFQEQYKQYYYYDYPYNFPKKLDEVLILGSGGGNDIAAALRAGARHVTAVEIDPVIIEFGKKLHPEKPYLSEKVTIINNDGRNFLRNTDKKFDLIVLGLVDSHTLTSNFSNTNLDSFMYTHESVGDMRDRLNDDGVLALSFQVVFGWMGSKIFHMVDGQFGSEPTVAYYSSDYLSKIMGTGGTYFLASKNKSLLSEKLDEDSHLKNRVYKSRYIASVYKNFNAQQQTDDWPYLYIETATIPTLHILVTMLLLIVFLVLAITMFGSPGKSDLHFMGLGAGFLLMEVAVISRFGLFWGTTWIISSIVISQILVAILVANSLYLWRGKGLPFPVIYAIIFVSLAAVYMVPLTSGWVILLYMVPFVAIGLLFAQSFDNAPVPSKALAYNLFGSLVGGLSESLSFVFGISALILVGMVFYGFSAIFTGAVKK